MFIRDLIHSYRYVPALRLFFVLLLFTTILCPAVKAQSLKFTRVLGNNGNDGPYLGIAQDKYGVMWFTTQLKGLMRYDGRETKSYIHDANNPNSPASNYVEAFIIDSANIFWLGNYGSGLDRFDPATNTFTHFINKKNDKTSLVNDTITTLFADREGNIWVGTLGGLAMLNKKTGQFTQYVHSSSDKESLSNNDVRAIYQDRAGTIWIGCGRPFSNLEQNPEWGGLNRFNAATGKFTRYMHNAADPLSISNNKVRAIFEDSKGNFWIGTRDDGLHIMDREKGTFTQYPYDPKQPGKLSRPRQFYSNGVPVDHIAFITEDGHGSILIGTYGQGINYFTPKDSTVKHYGTTVLDEGAYIFDTLSGLKDNRLWKAYNSSDGLIWVVTLGGQVYTAQSSQRDIPHYTLNNENPDANSLYCEPGGNILWIGTDHGLFQKNLQTGALKVWTHNATDPQSLCNDTITSLKVDKEGKFWLATNNGLCRFDPGTNRFTTWTHDKANANGLHSNYLNYLFIDRQNNIWIGMADAGVDKLDTRTGVFTNYRYSETDPGSLSTDFIQGICSDRQNNMWIATSWGLNKLNTKTGKINHYLPSVPSTCVFVDASGVLWASTPSSVFRYDSVNNIFKAYTDASLKNEIQQVINIIEDKQENLWLSTKINIIKINKTRDAVKAYDERNGVHTNSFLFSDNYVSDRNEIFLGDENGYYAFIPDKIKDNNRPPFVSFTGFKIDDADVIPGKGKPLADYIADAKEINLAYQQNNFSVEFSAVSYTSPGEMKYLFRLENYDDDWHNIGTERKAYFYNIPPGKYVLHVKGISADGTAGEKEIAIIITPPWWRTWWAYTLFALLFIAAVWSFIYYRSRQLVNQNRRLENKVAIRTKELKNEKEKVESTLTELKSTQAQLIQSEKMASLGQLTAGIAHEIQNPLNFVNNFSEINAELIEEAGKEADSGNITGVKEILNDLKENSGKINHHGKRAESIVKGMLQHSRASTGQKTFTDINALADEYLRLAFHGMRAKDKSFNATMKTDFDETIGKINIIPQDIGRVLLNLCNNAFYAASPPTKGGISGPVPNNAPTVWVSTKKEGNKVLISVSDNGNGIPQAIIDKIFQPFFTTKPTGEGTGLGLSISYDIIKAHGGDIKVTGEENKGTTFTVELPANG